MIVYFPALHSNFIDSMLAVLFHLSFHCAPMALVIMRSVAEHIFVCLFVCLFVCVGIVRLHNQFIQNKCQFLACNSYLPLHRQFSSQAKMSSKEDTSMNSFQTNNHSKQNKNSECRKK
jgi:hypothetical protein